VQVPLAQIPGNSIAQLQVAQLDNNLISQQAVAKLPTETNCMMK
jgi:hypothetical protein